MQPNADEWVTLARVLKTQGRRGELAAEILTDLPDRFADLDEVSLYLASTGLRRSVALQAHWFHKGGIVLHFSGCDDISTAEAWIGAEVQVPRAQRPPAPEGTVFVSDLVGCTVLADGREIGTITAVEDVPGAPPLLHLGDRLIPFVEPFIVHLDLDARRLELNLPSGLLDL